MKHSGSAQREALPAVSRAMRLVKIIGAADDRLSLGAITRAAGLPKSTVFKYLYTLAEAGFLTRDPVTDTYGIGPGLSRMNRVENHLLILSGCGRPALLELAPRIGLTLALAVTDGDFVRLIDIVRPPGKSSVVPPQAPIPAYASALGRVVVAAIPDGMHSRHRPRDLTALTPYTVVDEARYQSLVDGARERGWTADRGEVWPEIACVAAVIPGPHGLPAGAIGAFAPVSLIRPGREMELADRLVTAAKGLAERMGFTT